MHSPCQGNGTEQEIVQQRVMTEAVEVLGSQVCSLLLTWRKLPQENGVDQNAPLLSKCCW